MQVAVKSNMNFPNFGQFMPISEMKPFCLAAPFWWAAEDHWYTPHHDTVWDTFLSYLHDQFNDKHQCLVQTILLLLDESMLGWWLKMSKLGGLPNYRYKVHKPVPLGTMFWNGAECISGVLVYQDVVQLSEAQSWKKSLVRSHMSVEMQWSLPMQLKYCIRLKEPTCIEWEVTHGLVVISQQWRSNHTSMYTQHG